MAHIKTHALSHVESERLRNLYITHREQGQSFIKTTPGNCVLAAAYEKHKERIYNLQLRPDNVSVLTWPKNGSTWTQEMVWCIEHEFDFEAAKKLSSMQKFPFLEFVFITNFAEEIMQVEFRSKDKITIVEAMPSPRMVRSHLPYCLLPPNILDQCKVVTCLRNPKDTVVSYYHHEKLIKLHGYDGDFKEYFELFMDDLVIFSSYWDYTVEAWKRKDHPNMCLLFFEDMKNDLEGSVRKVAKFLQKDVTDGQVQDLVQHLSFKKMKENQAPHEDLIRNFAYTDPKDKTKCFFRKGEVGDWKNYFTDEMSKRMDETIEKHFGKIGLEFRYE